MATIVTRSGKGSPLTHAEVDSNFTNLNTDKLETAGGSMTGNLSFGDNDKAIFGAGSDLQIYHDGLNSYIDEDGAGSLYVRAYTGVNIQSKLNNSDMITATHAGAVTAYHNGSAKLATTSTGIDVTGTVTADGLTVDGDSQFGNSGYLIYNNANPDITLRSVGGAASYGNVILDANGRYGSIQFRTGYDGSAIDNEQRMKIDTNGDISFYEDTGTTAKFFWDASAEKVEIAGSGGLKFTGGGVSQDLVWGSSGSDYAAIRVVSPAAQDVELSFHTTTNAGVDGAPERMRIDSSGNVGIGTSSPAQILHLASSGPDIRIQDTDGGYADINVDGGSIELRSDQGNTQASSTLKMFVDGTERMRIDSSGNVGIGTNSPNGKLDITGSGNTDLYLNTGNNSGDNTRIFFGDTADIDVAYLAYDHGTNSMLFGVNASEAMRIDSSGNVGIGTSSPATSYGTALHIHNPAATGSNLRLTNSTSGSGTGNGFEIVQLGVDDYLINREAGAMVMYTNNSEAMRIDSSGNVGIGTSSPSYPLTTLAGTVNTQVAQFSGTDVGRGLRIETASTTRSDDTAILNASDAFGELAFETNSTERMRIDSSGRVGIGTSSPSSYGTLAVAGTIATVPDNNGYALLAGRYSSGYPNATLNSINGVPWVIQQGGTERMRIDSSGNVGIGTSSPSYKLDVDVGAPSSSDQVLGRFSSQAGTRSIGYVWDDSASTLGIATLTNNAMTFHINGNSNEKMRLDTSGNLLVGKTATNYQTVGVEAKENGSLWATADGNGPLVVTRKTSDGTLADFYRDTTKVGSIGAYGGDLFVGTGDAGLWFQDGGNAIRPFRVDTQAGHDASIDLGHSSNRFKDLYLSGGVYLGGTGSANKLDDYEEGTWTPTVTYASSGGPATLGTADGVYTKVGRVVTVSGIVSVSNTNSGSGQVRVGGLPFNVGTDLSSTGDEFTGSINYYTGFSSNIIPYSISVSSLNVLLVNYVTAATTTGLSLTAAQMGTGQFRFSATYFAT